jgi:hypothetical protein
MSQRLEFIGQAKGPRLFSVGIAPPGLDPRGASRADEPQTKWPALFAGQLPLLGSNPDSPDPEGPL